MGITWDTFQQESVHIKTIFIVDEVQMLYVPEGYHGAWDLSSTTNIMDVSPSTIPPENTWGMEDTKNSTPNELSTTIFFLHRFFFLRVFVLIK